MGGSKDGQSLNSKRLKKPLLKEALTKAYIEVSTNKKTAK
jgi:hypothetical protein